MLLYAQLHANATSKTAATCVYCGVTAHASTLHTCKLPCLQAGPETTPKATM